MTDLKIQTFFFWSKWDTWRNKSTREIILRWQWEFLAITVTSAIYVPSILVLTNQITRFLIKVDNTFSFSISNTFRSGYLEFKIIHWVSATYGGEVKLPGTTQPIPSASKLLFAFGSKLLTTMKRRLNKGAN